MPTLLALLLSLLSPARAADWVLIQGTEEGRADKAIDVGGFVQVGLETGVRVAPVTGLSEKLAAYEGQVAAFNLEPIPSFLVRRARPILRGSIPGTQQRIAWFLAVEFGQNGLTRASPVALADASVTFTAHPAFRLRAGQFKLPAAEESLQALPIAGEVVPVDEVARQLVLENRVVDGVYEGGASGFRDVGAQLFGNLTFGRADVAYALMLSNGGPGFVVDSAFDLTARVRFAWVFDGKVNDPFRKEFSTWIWRQEGTRTLGDVDVQRVRQGLGLQVELDKVRLLAEVVHAQGAVEQGANPPFAGSPVVVDPTGTGVGATLLGRVTLGRFALKARWSGLWRNLHDPVTERIFQSALVGVRWAPTRKVRVDLDYEARFLLAPGGTPDAQAIAASMGDRLFLETTLLF